MRLRAIRVNRGLIAAFLEIPVVGALIPFRVCQKLKTPSTTCPVVTLSYKVHVSGLHFATKMCGACLGCCTSCGFVRFGCCTWNGDNLIQFASTTWTNQNYVYGNDFSPHTLLPLLWLLCVCCLCCGCRCFADLKCCRYTGTSLLTFDCTVHYI